MEKFLSASRIKTLQSCSFLYYANYFLRIPQRSNSGALRGTLLHLIFELFLKPRHRKHYDSIIKENHIKGSPSVNRLAIKHLKHDKIYNEENYDLVNKMLLVGLKFDFYCEGGDILEPEYKFKLQKTNPKYQITGFMDKPVIYKDKKQIIINDYKGQRAKFSGEELTANVQAMMYSLAAKSLWPEYEPIIRFIQLRFSKTPLQEVKFTDSQLRGFEFALAELQKMVDEFDEKSAVKNFAADNKETRWMCQAGKTWKCPYLEPFEFYSVIDAEGNVKKSEFEKSALKPKEGEKVVKQRYSGCPRFRKE